VNPKSIEARLALSNFYLATERDADAERILDEARTLNPNHVLVNRMLASFLLSHNRVTDAEAPLKAAAAASKDPLAQVALADYYIMLRRYDQAGAVLKPFSEGAHPLSAAVLRLAAIERTEGRNDAATKDARRAHSAGFHDAEALTVQSSWALQDGDVAAGACKQPRRHRGRPQLCDRPTWRWGARSSEQRRRWRHQGIERGHQTQPENGRRAGAALEPVSRGWRHRGGRGACRGRTAHGACRPGRSPCGGPHAAGAAQDWRGRSRSQGVARDVSRRSGGARHERTDTDGEEDHAAARAAFNRALEKNPLLPEALEGLTVLDTSTGNTTQAIARIEGLVAKHPKEASLRFMPAPRTMPPGNATRSRRRFWLGSSSIHRTWWHTMSSAGSTRLPADLIRL
jgi:predicted Zn-dependent protease